MLNNSQLSTLSWSDTKLTNNTVAGAVPIGDTEGATMGKSMRIRQSWAAKRPKEKRALESDQEQGTEDVGGFDSKKQRQLTTPRGTLKSIDTNKMPSLSKLPISLEPERSASLESERSILVTDRKPAYKKKIEGYEDDYYNAIKTEYKAQRAESGTDQTSKGREEEFKDSVRKFIFNRIKFILKESDLDFAGPVFKCMVGLLKVEEDTGEDIEQYWNIHRKFVRGTLNMKRGAVNGMMKDAFMSK